MEMYFPQRNCVFLLVDHAGWMMEELSKMEKLFSLIHHVLECMNIYIYMHKFNDFNILSIDLIYMYGLNFFSFDLHLYITNLNVYVCN